MRRLPRWHTPASVAKQLIEGLESGTLTLGPPLPEGVDPIPEAIRLTAEINAGLARLDPERSPQEPPKV